LEHIQGVEKVQARGIAPKPPKCNCLQLRATDEQRALIQRSADLEGRSITDFILAAAQEKAMRIIESMEAIRLNAVESRRFAEALASEPREPSERQLATLCDYRRPI
jgi:uncharacterized protein (DUF1778 family)